MVGIDGLLGGKQVFPSDLNMKDLKSILFPCSRIQPGVEIKGNEPKTKTCLPWAGL